MDKMTLSNSANYCHSIHLCNAKLTIMHLNIRSIKPHFEQLKHLYYLLRSPPDILCLTDTWLIGSGISESWLISPCNQIYTEVEALMVAVS